MDDDVPCAIIAAGCLSNYASFCVPTVDSNIAGSGDRSGGASSTSVMDKSSEVMSQVTIPLLIRRISTGIEHCTRFHREYNELQQKAQKITCGNSQTNPETKSSPSQKLEAAMKEQWNLTSLCLQTLAELIENHPPLVVVRMNHVDSLLLMMKLMKCAMDCMGDDKSRIVDTENLNDEKKDHPVYQASMNAARVLHSLLDENPMLIEEISSASSEHNLTNLVKELMLFLANGNLPQGTRLHCCGGILSLRKMLLYKDEELSTSTTIDSETHRTLQSCTCTQILPMLHSTFSQPTPQSLVQNMIRLYRDVSNEERDEAMELEVTKEIHSRNESARSIARRQKEMKKKEMEADTKTENDVERMEGVAMVVEDDTTKASCGAAGSTSNPKEALEPLLHSWRDICATHKLALELVANLCSGQEEEEYTEEEEDGMMYDDENEHMWDSDDEAKLVMEGISQGPSLDITKCTHPSDREVYASMSSTHLVEQIFVFFQRWILFVPRLSLEGEDTCPRLVGKDVEEVLSTCAVCLGNMIASDISTWDSGVTKDVASLVCPGATVVNGVSLFWWGLVSLLKASELVGKNDAILHVTVVMLALLRHHTMARTLADAPTLDMLLNLLSQPLESKEGSDNDSSIPLQCNTIAMLGVLCSETHPATINDRVCAALTGKLRSVSSQINSPIDAKRSILIMNEVYNVLMDMYGGDDANDEVYQRQDVSGHLTRTLPVFKRSIKKVASVERDNEELGVWNETALNVTRFLRFKRDG